MLLLLGSFFLAGCGQDSTQYRIPLEVWGVFDDTDAYTQIFQQFRGIDPFIVDITYRKFSPDTYRDDLINALAAGKGPDIFMIGNTWLTDFQDKIVPAPDILLNEKAVRDDLVDVIAEDFITEDHKIWALPLSVDSLNLFYNKDILNAAGIAKPPATWEEFVSMLPHLTRVDRFGNITQSAMALGTAYNINRSTDILLAMSAQLGSALDPKFFNDEGATKALDFYTQFAKSSSSTYTWNPRLDYSLDAFYQGKVAMMLNYSYTVATIQQKNAKLNFGVAPMPQFSNQPPATFANYWAFAVAKNKTAPDLSHNSKGFAFPTDKYQDLRVNEAWELLRFMAFPHPAKAISLVNALSGNRKDFAVSSDPTVMYLEKTGKPAARRDLIEKQKTDVFLSPFATGNLIARSWKPRNPAAAETILAEGISAINRGEQSESEALSVISKRLQQFR